MNNQIETIINAYGALHNQAMETTNLLLFRSINRLTRQLQNIILEEYKTFMIQDLSEELRYRLKTFMQIYKMNQEERIKKLRELKKNYKTEEIK